MSIGPDPSSIDKYSTLDTDNADTDGDAEGVSSCCVKGYRKAVFEQNQMLATAQNMKKHENLFQAQYIP